MPLTLCVLLWPHEGREAELIAYEDQVLRQDRGHAGRRGLTPALRRRPAGTRG